MIGNNLPNNNPPLNLVFLPIFLVLISSAGVCAQSAVGTPAPAMTPSTTSSTQPDQATVVQTRIERARALAAAHQLNAAASELESIRKTVPGEVVRNITSVMLMGIYLEEGNYVRAESLLEEDFRERATGGDAAVRNYFATAGQALNGARQHLARYRSFGINVSDEGLPVEAVGDLDRLRRLLERMAAQAQEISTQRRSYDVLALLEDVLGIRLSLATDGEDRAKWESEYVNARQVLASSQSQIASLGGVPSLQRSSAKPSGVATPPTKEPPLVAAEPVAPATNPTVTTPLEQSSEGKEPTATPDPGNIISTGSLNTRATKRVVPTYPPLAKTMGTKGVVKVYVTIDESGKVMEVTSIEGPMVLRQAAEDAAKGWRFPPTAVDGKAVKLAGFIEFTFALNDQSQ